MMSTTIADGDLRGQNGADNIGQEGDFDEYDI